jgi:HK97 gp10 family phage protein
MEYDITVDGLDDVAEALGATLEQVLPAAAKGVGRAAEVTRDTAQDFCPVDTGELWNSISATPPKIEGDTVEASVIAGAEHAVYVEMGTGIRGAGSNLPEGLPAATYRPDWPGQVAQPYMYPAYKANEDKVKDLVADEIRKAVGG